MTLHPPMDSPGPAASGPGLSPAREDTAPMRWITRWPKRRVLQAESGEFWMNVIEPGHLVCSNADGRVLVFSDADQLRSFAMAIYAAAIELDLATQAAAAKESTDRRLRRQHAGHPTGVRHRPFTDAPEPPAHMEVPA